MCNLKVLEIVQPFVISLCFMSLITAAFVKLLMTCFSFHERIRIYTITFKYMLRASVQSTSCSVGLSLSWHLSKCQNAQLSSSACVGVDWLGMCTAACARLSCGAVWRSVQSCGMSDGGPGKTKTGQYKQKVTFRTRQRGFELKIEKHNSHP